MSSESPIALTRSAFFPNAAATLRVEQCLAWAARNPSLVFLVWSFWLAAEYLVFGASSYVRVHDNGDATLPMLLAHAPPNGLPWNSLALCGLDGWAWGVQITSAIFWLLPGWLAYGSFMWLQRFIAGYFMHRLLKDTLNISLLPSLIAGLVYSQFSQPSNNASWAGFTLYDTLGLPGLPLLIWTFYRLMKSGGWWWLPGGLFLGMAFGVCAPYAFAPFIMMACASWVLLAPPGKPIRMVTLAILFVLGCAVINLPTVWAGAVNAPLSHRAAWTANPSAPSSWISNLQTGWSFVADNLLPLSLATVGLVVSWKENRLLRIVFAFLGLALLFIIFYSQLMAALQGHLGFLAGFQFNRVYLIIPFLAAAAAAIGLESISRDWKLVAAHSGHLRWTITLPGALFAVATILLLNQSVSVKKRTLSELAGGANFSNLYRNPELQALAKKIKAGEPCRIATIANQNEPPLHPGFAWTYGMETADGYANLYPKRYQDYWEGVIGPLIKNDKERHDYFHYWGNRVYLFSPSAGFPSGAPVQFKDHYRLELLSLANVRYIVSPRLLEDDRLSLLPSISRDAQLNWAGKSKTEKLLSIVRGTNPGMPLYVYENSEAAPRYFLAGQVKAISGKDRLLDELSTASQADLKSTVYVSSDDATNSSSTNPAANPGSVSIVSETSHQIELGVTNDSPAILVIANLYSPLWTASVDKKSAHLFPANHAFQGLKLEAGHHRVVLRYQPPYALK